MICLNTNISVRNNQAFSQDNLQIYYSLGATLPASYDLHDNIKRFSKYTIALFRELVRRHMFQNNVHPSHLTLAKKLGCDVSTIKRAQKDLESRGVIKVKSGKALHEVNIYSLGEVLFTSDALYYLREIVPSLRFVVKKLQALFGLSTVENQNELRINKVLKDSNTNTSIYIDNSKIENRSPKNKQEIRNYSVHGWLPTKIFENVKALLRMDPFMSEEEARKISKYGEMNRINREKFLKATQNNPTAQELEERHTRVLEERKSLNDNISRAKKSTSGIASKFMDIVLNGSIGKF